MKWEKLNRDWFFKKGQVRVFPGEDEALYGEKVNLPHDYMIASDVSPDAPAGPAMGYYTEGAASYTKKMQIPAQWEGQKVYLHIDGVMMNASVNVNGKSGKGPSLRLHTVHRGHHRLSLLWGTKPHFRTGQPQYATRLPPVHRRGNLPGCDAGPCQPHPYRCGRRLRLDETHPLR